MPAPFFPRLASLPPRARNAHGATRRRHAAASPPSGPAPPSTRAATSSAARRRRRMGAGGGGGGVRGGAGGMARAAGGRRGAGARRARSTARHLAALRRTLPAAARRCTPRAPSRSTRPRAAWPLRHLAREPDRAAHVLVSHPRVLTPLLLRSKTTRQRTSALDQWRSASWPSLSSHCSAGSRGPRPAPRIISVWATRRSHCRRQRAPRRIRMVLILPVELQLVAAEVAKARRPLRPGPILTRG